MKTRFAILVLLAASFQALSQEVEKDDMYFTSRDRAKQNLLRNNEKVAAEKKLDADSRANSDEINPTDSYSSRNINPEYVSRSRSEAEDTLDANGYFQNNYSPSGVNNKLYNKYNSDNFYSPYYGNTYGYNAYNSGYSAPYNPYSPYSAFGNSFYGGFSPGVSFGLGYGMGSFYNGWYGNMGYGWGMPSNYFYNSFYMDPFGYNGYSSFYNPWNSWAMGGFYGPYFGYGSGYGWGYGGYGPSVIVINNDNNNTRHLAYQRRNDRSSTLDNNVSTSRTSVATTTRNGRPITTGRVNSESAQSQNYYQRSWRSNSSTGAATQTRTSQWSGNNTGSTGNNGSTGRSRTVWSSGGNSWDNGGGSNSRTSWSGSNSDGGSRSSWSGGGGSFGGGGGGGGSRSSGGGGGSSSGGGGGGGSRGRH